YRSKSEIADSTLVCLSAGLEYAMRHPSLGAALFQIRSRRRDALPSMKLRGTRLPAINSRLPKAVASIPPSPSRVLRCRWRYGPCLRDAELVQFVRLDALGRWQSQPCCPAMH